MPRFPVNFRRKSTAAEDQLQDGPIAGPSFRVLDRSDVNSGKSFDGGASLAKRAVNSSRSNLHDPATDENLFAGFKNNRGSGSSNGTKTASDNSSRHSNTSTAPSSTEYGSQEDWRNSINRKPLPPVERSSPPVPKNSTGFLKQAGRTFSFGGNKKNSLPTIPAEDLPVVPTYDSEMTGRRPRAETTSTTSTATPPKVEDEDFSLDLGGDLTSMLKFDKRASVATLKGLTNNRPTHPSPLHLDNAAPVEPPPQSLESQHSRDGLLVPAPLIPGGNRAPDHAPPPVPKHEHVPVTRRDSNEDDEDTILLRESMLANEFLASTAETKPPNERYRPRSELTESYSKQNGSDMFDKPYGRSSRGAPRIGSRSLSQPQNKVMTPAEFEKYRQDKAKDEMLDPHDSDKEEENYEDDEEDEVEKSKELAKQRRKQEAQMTVYRQQMMKITGESSTDVPVHRPAVTTSLSTPNLSFTDPQGKGTFPSPPSDGSDDDEEVPLAILAAHGFPNKNRAPARLSTMGSNPNLRASMQPSYTTSQGPSGGEAGNRTSLPPFARKLPQDPYLGAGLINQPPRESFALGGGASPTPRAAPTGGLVGVIANEERSRAMRRGTPAVDSIRSSFPPNMPTSMLSANGGFDPVAGIPHQMMYPGGMPQAPPALTPGDQAQIQMTQQMQQFMQMQMQFMQMMAGQNQTPTQGPPRPQSHMPSPSLGSLEMGRKSFMGDYLNAGTGSGAGLEVPRTDPQMRTMSMVQPPTSGPWLQPPSQGGYAPSIRAPAGGYTPSIAPSERSNVGLPGRYRPVSSINLLDSAGRTSSMTGTMSHLHSKLQAQTTTIPIDKDDDDDEEGWEAMRAKREQRKTMWRAKKNFGSDIGALIS
ncbi:hypothetical protein F4780DRAFT_773116 [Xylariomycetidae sp. FL0641]|nr:hypothetical protein F4780DRAFT_773116 [Xylariomycetidae sp. FL0641]